VAKKKLIKVIDDSLWRQMKAISYLRDRKIEDIVEEAFREYIINHRKQYNALLKAGVEDEGPEPNQ